MQVSRKLLCTVIQGPRLLLPWRSPLDHLCPAGRWRRKGCWGFYGPSLEMAYINFLHIPLVTKHQGRLGGVLSVYYGLN